MTDRTLVVPGGHQVACAEYGAPDGSPVLYLHGAGSNRLEGAAFDAPARAQGIRLVALDRPGRSLPLPPTASPLAYAAEVAAVADHLGIGRFVVAGQSNGGMFACAVAHALGDRVSAVVPINPTVPAGDPAVRAVLDRSGRLAYNLIRRFPGLMSRAVSGAGLKEPTGRRAAHDPDAGLWQDPLIGAVLRDVAREQTTVDYLRNELDLGIVHPWDFDHLALAQPVEFFMGERDGGLPYVRVWSEGLPDSRVHVVPGGHIAHLAPAAADELVALLAGSPAT
ncbi:MAG: alpha/beta fold hydrolase [Actinobacteria bacterium]|uniref:Unannotated protein n=1 Tax=freshwater metagenome TaxID=449393 RepID=A0A6J6NTS8_9ZZZZ|nr:alpha/beta fold hydrolase [Actinomycetota bacterium]